MAAEAQEFRASLLTIPLEVRHMIYILIQDPREISPCQPKILWPAQSTPGSYIFRYGFPKPNHRPFESLTLYGLRSTNRQLYRETLNFITFPKLCLRVVDWFTSPTVAFSGTQRLTSDEFARDNIITVQLHFALSGRSLNNLNSPREPPAPASNSLFVTMKKALKDRISRASGQQKTPMQLYPFSLQPLVPLLDACPRLTFVSIATDDEAFYDLWQDPAGDLEAFLPMFRRGVHIQIQQYPIRSMNLGPAYVKFDRMLEDMSRSKGADKTYLTKLGKSSCAKLQSR